MKITECIAICSGALLTASALAHHSFAMFDQQTRKTLTGTVKEFQWTNPHCWIQVLVPGENGSEEWSVEMASSREMFRGGWKPGSLKPGDKLTVVIHPLLDGRPGGSFVSAVGPDGRALGN